MVRISAKTFLTLIVGVATEIANRDIEIQRHHSDINDLKTVDMQLATDNANKEYAIGMLKGQVSELTERLQLSEDSNKNIFNENSSLTEQNRELLQKNGILFERNKDLIRRDVETTTELDAIKEGTPPVLATEENVRNLLKAIKTNDTLVIAEQVHKLMDTPLVQAMALVKETLSTVENGEFTGPVDNEDIVGTSGVSEDTAKEVELQVG